MIYKDDWDKCKERLKAWWEGEIIDRVVIQVVAPRKAEYMMECTYWWNPWRLVHNLDNSGKVFQEFEEWCKKMYFGGEFAPNLFINLGPGITAAYLGVTPEIREDTVWFEAKETMSWNRILNLKLDPENKWWKITKDLTRLSAEYGKDKFLTSITDLNAILNILCSFRGTQTLLTDLFDYPQEVKKSSTILTDIWFLCYDELLKITQMYQEGSITWMGIWSPGRGSDVQCDFSAMISPNMFEEFVVPHLQEQCRRLEHSVYHWDGPGQIPHLDLLLDIPELDALQWTPGAGQPDVSSPKWFPLYKRIQEKGKLLVLLGAPKERIENLLSELSPKGLLIRTVCNSQEEAEELLCKAEQWTKNK